MLNQDKHPFNYADPETLACRNAGEGRSSG